MTGRGEVDSTSRVPMHRRGVLVGLSGIAASVTAGRIGTAFAQAANSRFRGIAVDTRPLAAIGGGASAVLIQRILPGKLAAVFADRLAPKVPGVPTLLARIDTLHLSAYADAPSEGFGTLSNMDSMEGAGVVMAGRQIRSVTPLRVTLPAGYSGAYYLPDIDQRRIASLCESFASWLGRETDL